MYLKVEIEKIAVAEQIKAGVIPSSVGCISKSRFRVTNDISIKEIKKNMEPFN
ncbi:hypothetical protein [Psychrilyobacter sp.]|uniref:hypothetical protein n=1 Tax=Psychrilyobacter sp. TaxID=2586924 RepID=UPI0030199CEA